MAGAGDRKQGWKGTGAVALYGDGYIRYIPSVDVIKKPLPLISKPVLEDGIATVITTHRTVDTRAIAGAVASQVFQFQPYLMQ